MRAAGLPAVLGVDPAFFLPQERLPLPEGWREGDTVGVNVSPLILRCAEDGAAVLGGVLTGEVVWEIADLHNCCMIFINLTGVIGILIHPYCDSENVFLRYRAAGVKS